MPLPTLGSPAPWPAGITDHQGRAVTLSQFAGKHVLLYFYPKDDTPGCTIEACNFRDHHAELPNTVILGASLDGAASHQAFAQKFSLPFPLLVGRERALATAFGAGEGPADGYAKRISVLIGPDGRVKAAWPKVDPKVHWQEVQRAVTEG